MTTNALPPRFVGFLVGQFLAHGVFKEALEAQTEARRIVDNWNKAMELDEARRSAEVQVAGGIEVSDPAKRLDGA